MTDGEITGVETVSLAAGLHHESVFAWMQGDFQQAETLAHRGVGLARKIGAQSEQAYALLSLAAGRAQRGHGEAAEAAAAQALPLFVSLNDAWGKAMSLNTLGNVAADLRGDTDRAEALYIDALTQFRIAGDPAMIALATGNLGILATARGEYDRAEALLTEALAASQIVGDARTAVLGVVALGDLALARGDSHRAILAFGESLVPLRDLD